MKEKDEVSFILVSSMRSNTYLIELLWVLNKLI